ncbi:protein PELOTA 1-like [Abrus precatorius]|uniref:Protein pelota homolog n=1 Tax=Abrus precatorius TaxID=3816 RepID=A0A8B8KZ27_ABRPR|nr:protein PELOTA 1-like [Abrus precatorius]
MKLLQKDFAANQSGTAKIMPEEPDDVWLLYNLILPGDVVSADTTRKVRLESTKTAASRVKITLHLKVTCRDFLNDSSTLRLRGKNLQPNPYVAAGSFHTLTLEPNKTFDLRKKLWNSDAVEALNESAQNSKSSSSLAVVLFHQSHAEIYLVGNGATTRFSNVEASSNSSRNKAVSSTVFFRDVFAALVRHVDFTVVKRVVIASEASTKDEFRRFVLSEAKRLRMTWMEENKSRIVVASSGKNGDLGEVLGDRAVTDLIKDSKVGIEVRAFRELWDMVCNNSDRACYGPHNVESAHEMRAIETLLITDELYRNADIGIRQRYGGLVKEVKEGGGKVLVYSSMHVSAPQLSMLTGVAAILRFPLPHLQDFDV